MGIIPQLKIIVYNYLPIWKLEHNTQLLDAIFVYGVKFFASLIPWTL
jgi:hypothetical protein